MAYAPFFVKGAKKRSGEEKEAYIRFHVGRWGKRAFSLTKCKVKVIGAQNIPLNGAYIIVANHQSMLDIPLIQGYVNPHAGFIAKKELSNFFTIGSFIKVLGGELIDRTNPRNAALAIENIIKKVKNEGQVIALFPEGTRSTDGNVHDFKVGAVKLITKAGMPVLPIAISGTEKSMPKGSVYIKKSYISLSIMPVIDPKDFKNLNAKELSEMLREKISSELLKIKGDEKVEGSKIKRVSL